jgi:pimeloyl-ACP methyl ester carboxylesterase
MEQVTSRDGTQIAFDGRGEGAAVVLVDGALSYGELGVMPALANELAGEFTVYRYDRRGRGGSGDTAPYAVAREVEDLAAVIGAAGGSARVFGLSSGAVLALEAAASGLPIERLVLYEPPYDVSGGDPEEHRAYIEHLEGLLAAGRHGDAVDWFLSNAGVPEEALAAMHQQPDWPLFEGVAPTLAYDHLIVGTGAVPRERAAAITAPTLVANGERSPDFFHAAAEATAAAIPRGEHRVLAGAGWGTYEAAALAPLVADFLR